MPPQGGEGLKKLTLSWFLKKETLPVASAQLLGGAAISQGKCEKPKGILTCSRLQLSAMFLGLEPIFCIKKIGRSFLLANTALSI